MDRSKLSFGYSFKNTAIPCRLYQCALHTERQPGQVRGNHVAWLPSVLPRHKDHLHRTAGCFSGSFQTCSALHKKVPGGVLPSKGIKLLAHKNRIAMISRNSLEMRGGGGGGAG